MKQLLAVLALTACASSHDVIRTPAVTPAPAATRTVELAVTDAGFEPAQVALEKGEPVTLVITRKTDATCAKDIVVPQHGIKAALPLDRPVEVTFTPDRSGELRYGCAMDQMVGGVLLVE